MLKLTRLDPELRPPVRADLRDAFHEAGHAVVAVLHDVAFLSVSLKKIKGDHHGYRYIWTEGVVYPPADELVRTDLLQRGEITESELMISLAGMLAESIHLGRCDEECRAGGAYDMQNLCVALAIRLGCEPETVSARLEWKALTEPAVKRCIKLLNAHWRAVDRIATRLVQRRRLGWEAVREVVEAPEPDRRLRLEIGAPSPRA